MKSEEMLGSKSFFLEVIVLALLSRMLVFMVEGDTHYYDFVVSSTVTYPCGNPITPAEYKAFFFYLIFLELLFLFDRNIFLFPFF